MLAAIYGGFGSTPPKNGNGVPRTRARNGRVGIVGLKRLAVNRQTRNRIASIIPFRRPMSVPALQFLNPQPFPSPKTYRTRPKLLALYLGISEDRLLHLTRPPSPLRRSKVPRCLPCGYQTHRVSQPRELPPGRQCQRAGAIGFLAKTLTQKSGSSSVPVVRGWSPVFGHEVQREVDR